MSICTTTDVYSAASLIGHELQLLIDEHGAADFESLMYKIIFVLEKLEFCVSHSTDTEQLIKDLQEQHDMLKSERNEQNFQDFTLDLDLMQQSWYNETQKLIEGIAELESENQRLKHQLENVEVEAEAELEKSITQPSVLDLVVGLKKQSCRPSDLGIKSSEMDSLLALTEERLLTQQENRAADLQLIRLLKTGVINQAQEVKAARQEVLFVEASIDAAEEEVCRLARESGRLMAAKSSKQDNHLSSERATVETQLAVCEQKLQELSLLIGSNQEVELSAARTTPLHMASDEGLESMASTGNGSDEQDGLLDLEELRSLLYERNRLRCRLIELNAVMETLSEAGEKEESLQGPLPREPMEKLFPVYANSKSTIKRLFVELMQRISKK